jgi:hypothetical protein
MSEKMPDYYPKNYEWPVYTICGSMRYYDRMLEIAQSETERGHIILMPFLTTSNPILKEMLDLMHKAKIDKSKGIIVVGRHIGDSTKSEINYARATDKTVKYVD